VLLFAQFIVWSYLQFSCSGILWLIAVQQQAGVVGYRIGGKHLTIFFWQLAFMLFIMQSGILFQEV
jgi:hypothetical protein